MNNAGIVKLRDKIIAIAVASEGTCVLMHYDLYWGWESCSKFKGPTAVIYEDILKTRIKTAFALKNPLCFKLQIHGGGFGNINRMTGTLLSEVILWEDVDHPQYLEYVAGEKL